jgi:hypothetical protein
MSWEDKRAPPVHRPGARFFRVAERRADAECG